MNTGSATVVAIHILAAKRPGWIDQADIVSWPVFEERFGLRTGCFFLEDNDYFMHSGRNVRRDLDG
jgi:hypothetical protein